MKKKKLNKHIIARNFSSAAHKYDQHSDVQKIAAQHLCHISLPFIKENHKIIDLGCGTSTISKYLDDHDICGLDISLAMLQHNHCAQSICADIEHLPIADASFDVIISSFSLQWINDFDNSFTEFQRILKKDGIIALCLPVLNSLCELKKLSTELECHFNFNEFAHISTIENALLHLGFKKEYLENHIIKTTYDNALQALKSIKNIGARYCDTPDVIKKSAFKHFKKIDNNFDLTWDVLYLVFQKD